MEDLYVAGMKLKVIVVAFDDGATVLRIPENKAESAGLRKFDRRIDSSKNKMLLNQTHKYENFMRISVSEKDANMYNMIRKSDADMYNIIKKPFKNKATIYSLFFLAVLAATFVAPKTRINFWGIYLSFEECLADRMQGVGSDAAARAIAHACRNKYEPSTRKTEITNLVSNMNIVLQSPRYSSSFEMILSHETPNYHISRVTINFSDGVRSGNYDCDSSGGIPPRTRGTLYCNVMRESFNSQNWTYYVSKIYGYRM